MVRVCRQVGLGKANRKLAAPGSAGVLAGTWERRRPRRLLGGTIFHRSAGSAPNPTCTLFHPTCQGSNIRRVWDDRRSGDDRL